MLLSGFTFIRNALKYDFPIEEAVRSMLPIVDELIINLGNSDDKTDEMIIALCEKLREPDGSSKIRLLHSQWDDTKTDSGLVLSEQTNIALAACRAPWALYLQADEALHEDEHAAIRKAVEEEQLAANPVDGFQFRYLHFYGGYSLVQRPWNWYPSEIRIVRTGQGLKSFGDAQTFRRADDSKLSTRLLDAHVFHYGHAREPEKMKTKIQYFHRFWHGDNHGKDVNQAYNLNWKDLVWYWGSHPAPYKERISKATWSPQPKSVDKLKDSLTRANIFTKSHQSLANELKTLLETQGIKTEVLSLYNSLRNVSIQNLTRKQNGILIDLDAEDHGLEFFLTVAPLVKLGFKQSVAHAPTGRLASPMKNFYTSIAWGCHEKADQGFHVPEKNYATQLLKCVENLDSNLRSRE